jgi:hypothetical protein
LDSLVEETENFYVDNGFRISQRIGRYQGEIQEFNPPLKWDYFRKPFFVLLRQEKELLILLFWYGKNYVRPN